MQLIHALLCQFLLSQSNTGITGAGHGYICSAQSVFDVQMKLKMSADGLTLLSGMRGRSSSAEARSGC